MTNQLPDATTFGRWIKRILDTPEAYEVLGPVGTWQAGGCWILAEAIQKVLGPKAKLVAIASTRTPVEHVVVEFDGKYIDADGAFTETRLLSKMRTQEFVPSPRLVTFSNRLKREARENELVCPAISVQKLVTFIRKANDRRRGDSPAERRD
jgi:hypothetical protein